MHNLCTEYPYCHRYVGTRMIYIMVGIDLLAGRKTVGTIEGNVAFAGVKPTTEFLRRFTGYVEQFGAQFRFNLIPIFFRWILTRTKNVFSVATSQSRIQFRRGCQTIFVCHT